MHNNHRSACVCWYSMQPNDGKWMKVQQLHRSSMQKIQKQWGSFVFIINVIKVSAAFSQIVHVIREIYSNEIHDYINRRLIHLNPIEDSERRQTFWIFNSIDVGNVKWSVLNLCHRRTQNDYSPWISLHHNNLVLLNNIIIVYRKPHVVIRIGDGWLCLIQ